MIKKNKTFTYPPYLGVFASLTAPLFFHQVTRISLQVNICCPFISTGGWGKKGHCFVSVVSVFSVTHSSPQKTNSPNESGCAVAAPGVSHSAPASSPEPFAGSVPKGLGSRTRPLIPCSSHHHPQLVLLARDSAQELCANPAMTCCS